MGVGGAALDEMLDVVFERSSHGSKCWRQKIVGDPLSFIEALEARLGDGQYPNFVKVSGLLKKHYAFPISPDVIRRHYSGKCACR